MKKQFSIAEAKNGLPQIVHQAEDGCEIEITRRGRPVAVIVSFDDYCRIQGSQRSFWESLQAFWQQPDAVEARRGAGFTAHVRDRSIGRRVRL